MRAKVKVIKRPLTEDSAEITDMFNQLVGAGDVNVSIAHPRYVRMLTAATQLGKLWRMLYNAPSCRRNEYFSCMIAGIGAYCDRYDSAVTTYFSCSLNESAVALNAVDEADSKRFTAAYADTMLTISQILPR